MAQVLTVCGRCCSQPHRHCVTGRMQLNGGYCQRGTLLHCIGLRSEHPLTLVPSLRDLTLSCSCEDFDLDLNHLQVGVATLRFLRLVHLNLCLPHSAEPMHGLLGGTHGAWAS
jgi:hypothetical protein